MPDEILSLRSSGKFSDRLIKKVNRYIHEHYDITAKKASKPEFGKRIAEIATEEEIGRIAELAVLATKIGEIIN